MRRALQDWLQPFPGVGPSIAADLRRRGVKSVRDLLDPATLWRSASLRTGRHVLVASFAARGSPMALALRVATLHHWSLAAVATGWGYCVPGFGSSVGKGGLHTRNFKPPSKPGHSWNGRQGEPEPAADRPCLTSPAAGMPRRLLRRRLMRSARGARAPSGRCGGCGCGGTSAARRATRSSGSSTTCVVPSWYGVLRV